MRNLPLILLGLAIMLALGTLRLADPKPLRDIRNGYFDMLQQLAPREPLPVPVVVVDIGEASLARIGQWPWPRDVLADLVTRLTEGGAAVIALDVLFAEPDRMTPARLAADPLLSDLLTRAGSMGSLEALDRDRILAEAMSRSRVVLGTARIAEPTAAAPERRVDAIEIAEGLDARLPVLSAMTPIAPPLEPAAAGVGSISMAPDGTTSVVRRVPLLWQTETGILPALSIETLRVALGEESILLWPDEAAPPGLDAIGIGSFDVPVSPDGQFWLHYRPEDRSRYVPAHAVLEGGRLPELNGAIVFVGSSAAGLLDIRTTPLGETVPGVSIHAQVVEQILGGQFLTRTDFGRGLEFLLFISLGLIVTAVMSISGPALSMAAGGAAGVVTAWAGWTAYAGQGLLLDITFPFIGGFLAFSLLTAFRLVVLDRDARVLKRSFSHFVSPEVLGQIERGGSSIELGGTIREVTVMFSDIRDFTGLSTRLDAQDLVALLNGLFTRMGDAILSERGTIDKFMGDAIMAFWNAPVEMADHPRRACAAALAICAALERFNASRSGPAVRIGVGIALGNACVGNIGARQHFNYTVIGDSVNAAARIEAACRRLSADILASDAVRAAVPDMAWLDAGRVELRGFDNTIRVHTLVGGADTASRPAFQSLAAAHAALLSALAQGHEAAEHLARCRGLAEDLQPGLASFYDAIPARRGDFRGRDDANSEQFM